MIRIFAYSKKPLNISSPYLLAQYGVIVVYGIKIADVIAERYAKKIYRPRNHSQAFRMLLHNQGDLVLGLESTSDQILNNREFKNKGVKKVGNALYQLTIHLFLHERHRPLKQRFERALQKLQYRNRLYSAQSGPSRKTEISLRY